MPDTKLYPEFDENLRDAMTQETLLFVDSQMREDRSVTELLTADYTFLNERLAQHYGIPDIYGSRFRRVTFTGGIRGGLLGQASVLTVTSYPNRTSVVIRGQVAVREYARPPPPPPPPLNVPVLKEAGEDGQPRALRERMEIHRKNPVCASAISGWTRWVSRLRISTHSENGATKPMGCPSMPWPHYPTARTSMVWAGCARSSPATKRILYVHSPGSFWLTQSAGVSNITICPRSARSRVMRRTMTTVGHQ